MLSNISPTCALFFSSQVDYDMNQIIGSHDLAMIVLDTLRFDVADTEMVSGHTPNLAALFPGGWEKRHTPGTFTYPAHHAFFAGFLPTPVDNRDHQRLFAARFAGSETTGENSCVFDSANIIEGLRSRNYHTICLGGVGFFNNRTPLSNVFPSMFDESHWTEATGVTDPDSTSNQFGLAARRLGEIPEHQRLFTFINVSAIHQPNYFYVDQPPADKADTLESHAAALRYVDSQLPTLTEALASRAKTFLIVCSDHGTLYGEAGGLTGHRFPHDAVVTVPYGETILPRN